MDKMTFRFDDVCINSDMELHNKMTDYLFEKFPDCEVIWAVSPLTHSDEEESGRVYPKEWNPLSDFTNHYYLNSMGLPEYNPKVTIATHGLIHCDHRLLTKEVQELSIILSSTLVDASMFVPPFNMYNDDTETICNYFGIELIRFEDGWASMEHNKYSEDMDKIYLHARCWTFETFKSWFEK